MAIEIQRGSAHGVERYRFDFKVCTYEKGWAQVDTRQDAPYYGTWTNPEKRQIFCYCEGDTTLTSCDTNEDYVKAVSDMVNWNKKSGYWLGIDPGLKPEMRAKFVSLGLEEFLHGSAE